MSHRSCFILCTRQRFINQGPVVQKLDSAIHRINLYPVDNAIGFPNTYPLDSDLSGGWRYPIFEQLGPGVYLHKRLKGDCIDNVVFNFSLFFFKLKYSTKIFTVKCVSNWPFYFKLRELNIVVVCDILNTLVSFNVYSSTLHSICLLFKLLRIVIP